MKYLMSAAIVMAASLQLHAFPLMEHVIQKMVPSSLATRDESCTSFTGHWKGICTVNGKNQTAEVGAITQMGCSIISFNSTTLFIGGTTDVSNAFRGGENAYTASYTVTADWTDSKTKLATHLMGNGRQLDKNGLFPFNGDGSISMEGNKLKVDMKLLDSKVECTYDRD